MAYTKPLVTTTVTVHGVNDALVFEDDIDNGKTVRYGSIARQQILRGETIDSVNSLGSAIIVPYHAIIMASVVVAPSEPQTAPPDDFCVAENADDGGADDGGADDGGADDGGEA